MPIFSNFEAQIMERFKICKLYVMDTCYLEDRRNDCERVNWKLHKVFQNKTACSILGKTGAGTEDRVGKEFRKVIALPADLKLQLHTDICDGCMWIEIQVQIRIQILIYVTNVCGLKYKYKSKYKYWYMLQMYADWNTNSNSNTNTDICDGCMWIAAPTMCGTQCVFKQTLQFNCTRYRWRILYVDTERRTDYTNILFAMQADLKLQLHILRMMVIYEALYQQDWNWRGLTKPANMHLLCKSWACNCLCTAIF